MPLQSMNTWSLSTKSALVALETRSEKQDVKGELIPEGQPGIFVQQKDSEKSEFLLGAITVHEPPMKVAFADTCSALRITVESKKDVKEELGKTGGKTDENYPIQFEPKAQIDQADTDLTDPSMECIGPLDTTETQYKPTVGPWISLGIPFNRSHTLTHMHDVSDSTMVPVLTVERTQPPGDCPLKTDAPGMPPVGSGCTPGNTSAGSGSVRRGDDPGMPLAGLESTLREDVPGTPSSGSNSVMKGDVPGRLPADSNSAMTGNAPGKPPGGFSSSLIGDAPGKSPAGQGSAMRGVATGNLLVGSCRGDEPGTPQAGSSMICDVPGTSSSGSKSALRGDVLGRPPEGPGCFLRVDTPEMPPAGSSRALRGDVPDTPPAGLGSAMTADDLDTHQDRLGSTKHIDYNQGDQYGALKDQSRITEDHSGVTDFRTGSTEDIAVADWSSSSDGNDLACLWSSLNKDISYTPNSGALRFIETSIVPIG